MIDLIFATIDNGCYQDCLKTCAIENILVKNADKPPATIYNNILDETKERFVCFIHSDVRCNGITQAIEKTINEKSGYLIGAVGVKNGYHWSRKTELFELITADSCCIVVDKELGLRFDDKLFNEYHLYVEDICMQCGKVCTMYLDAFSSNPTNFENCFVHYGYTWNKLGKGWGSYKYFRNLISEKWPNVQTT
jgi:hypothetical protein